MPTVLIRIGESGGSWRVELSVDDGGGDWPRRPAASEPLPDSLAAFDPPPLKDGRSGLAAIRAVLLEQAENSDDFETIGTHLHEVIARGAVGAAWHEIVEAESGYGRRDGVRLLLDVPDSISMLPWELMSRDSTRLAADVGNPFARVTAKFKPGVAPPSVRWPLRVLVVVGSREDDKIVEAEQEIAELTDAFRRMLGFVAFDFLRQPSREEVAERYRELQPHIFHFIGHGGVKGDRGQLELYDRKKRENTPWTLTQIGMDLAGWQPRLAILNACRTSDAGDQEGAWRVSEKFTKMGVPAVVAMQADIRGDSAAAFTGGLYRALTDGEPLDAAVAAGRVAITRLRGEDHRDFALPSLSVSWPPEHVLRLGCGTDEQRRPPVASMPRHFRGFVDRTAERGKLSRGLEPDGEEAGYRRSAPPALIAVVGDSQVGKTALAQWCVSAIELNGGNAAYVDLGEQAGVRFLETLEAIRDALGRSPTHGERNRRAFAPWDEQVAAYGDLNGSPPPPSNVVETVFTHFNDALREAAGERPLLLVLDHVSDAQGRGEDANWNFVCTRLLEPVAQRALRPARAVVVLSTDQFADWSTEPVEHVPVPMFEPSEFKLIARQYIRFRFDVTHADLNEKLAQVQATERFTWGNVAGLERLAPIWGWSELA